MKITSTKQIDFKRFRNDVDKALNEIAKQYGLETLSAGNVSYTDTSFTMKLEGTTYLTDAKKDQLDNDIKSIMKMYGIGDYYNATIMIRNKRFKVVNINPRAKKMPVELMEVGTNNTFKCTVQAVLNSEKV